MPFSTSQRARFSTSVARLIEDIENANDLRALDLHFHRAGAYIAAVQDFKGIVDEEIYGLLFLIDQLHQHGVRRLSDRTSDF